MIRATVSGSFHRHMSEITAAVYELASRKVRVLSPADPRVVDAHGEFLFVASDRVRSIRLVQDRHLEAIRSAHFLWLVCPDGYVGQSAAMEIGFAAGAGVRIFSTGMPVDLTLREYIRRVGSIDEAILLARTGPAPEPCILIDPHDTIERAHDLLSGLDRTLIDSRNLPGQAADVQAGVAKLRELVKLPTYLH